MHSNGRVYELKELDAATECAMEEKYKQDIQTIMKSGNQNAIFELVYRLIKDKSDFIAEEISEIDVDGNAKTVKIGGVEKLKRALTGGVKEQMDLANALSTAIYGKSAEDLIKASEKAIDEESKKKKKTK